jgi:hypothetical protein
VNDPVRRLADAVLYEGYLLWPYRRSALKNQQRFTFGGVYPPSFDDRSELRASALIEGEGAEAEVAVRFLHVVHRQVLAGGVPVAEHEACGERWVTWDEATEREVAPGPLAVPAGEEREPIPGGALVRSWRALSGTVEVEHEPLGPGLARIGLRIANTAPWTGTVREDALRHTLCSTHAVLRARGGAWISLTDPPPAHRAAAEACVNDGLWPVLVGAPGSRDTLLASPIILSEHPAIAPESPGDLFDSGEIDQMLVLNILAMTEEERREMRAADPRARAILERTEALGAEEIMRLHGAVRESGLARSR